MSGNTVQIRNGVLKVARTRQMTRTWRLNVWWLRLELAALMYFFSVIWRLIKLTPYMVWQVNSTCTWRVRIRFSKRSHAVAASQT
jgi:hypothetical protein